MARPLKCAVCKSELKAVALEGITIDQCTFCQALWFDAGELESYSRNHGPLDHIGEFSGHVFAAKRSSQKKDCPRCDSQTLQFGVLSKYDVWRCDECKGFFVFSETIDVLAPEGLAGHVFSPVELLVALLVSVVR